MILHLVSFFCLIKEKLAYLHENSYLKLTESNVGKEKTSLNKTKLGRYAI